MCIKFAAPQGGNCDIMEKSQLSGRSGLIEVNAARLWLFQCKFAFVSGRSCDVAE
jgi:hypothetical protein